MLIIDKKRMKLKDSGLPEMVIAQTPWYAKRGNKRGVRQRVFKRTPIHDHFRVQQNQLLTDCKYICKYPTTVLHENMITLRFWIVTILLAAITIITLKIR